jgi:long-subunit fatty acid transport protein
VRDENDPGKFYGQELGLTRLTYFSPTVSWQYSDTLTFGFGVGFSYFGVGLTLDYRAPSAITGAVNGLQSGQCNVTPDINICGENAGFNPFEKVFTLEADVNEPFSPTVNFGVLWEPNAWLTLGAVYQTESSDRLEGDLTVDIAQNITNFLFAAADDLPFVTDNTISSLTGITRENNGRLERTGYIDVTMPQHLAIGASVQVSPRWKVNVDWKWTETSAWDNLAFYFDEPLPILSTLSPIVGVDQNAIVIPRGYEDASNFAYGVEYQFSDQIALRAGYEPRDSGIPKDKRDFLIPLGDSKLYGLGASWTPDASHVYEIALGYTKVDEFVPAASSTNGNDTRTDNFVYNPSAGMDVGYMLEAYLVEFSYHTRY